MIDFPNQPPELDYGNREYKRQLYLKNNYNFRQKATQMLYRIYEGNGNALYFIGINDDGKVANISHSDILESVKCIEKIASIIEAKIKSIRYYGNDFKKVATIRINKEL